MLLPSLLKSGDQVYQKVIKQLYQKMLLLNLLITQKEKQEKAQDKSLKADKPKKSRGMKM